jgi:hypothetical protein
MKVRARFIEGRTGGLAVLEVMTPLDHPLGARVPRLAAKLDLRIAHSEQQRGDQRLVQRWVLTEADGRAIDDQRRAQVQALLLEEMTSLRPPAPSSSDLNPLQ